MNYVKKFMEDNNIEIDEEVKVWNSIAYLGLIHFDKYYNMYLNEKVHNTGTMIFEGLLRGNFTIEKLPFVPKGNEIFYYIDPYYTDGFNYEFTNNTLGKQLLYRGVTPYRTEAEVIAKVKELGW